MSDPVIIALIIRGILAFMLAVVGGWCVYLGWRLLFSKAHQNSKSSFKTTIGSHELSFSAGTAGTAIVFTSAAWMIGAVLTAPKLENPSGITVAFGPEIINATGVESVAAIEFEGNNVSLSKSQIKELKSFASYLKTIETSPNIIVEGYSNNDRSELGRKVAKERVEAVKNYMVTVHKFNPNRIQVVPYSISSSALDLNRNAVVLTATSRNGDS